MGQLKFKTNIKCGGCIETVTPYLTNIEAIRDWKVDLESPDRILIIEGDGVSEELVIKSLEEAGYRASIVE